MVGKRIVSYNKFPTFLIMNFNFRFIVFIILSLCYAQSNMVFGKDYPETHKLRRGLLESLKIFYDPISTPTHQIEWKEDRGQYTIERFTVQSQKNESIPGYVLIPKDAKPPYPVMICLQGHSPGMHISLGQAKSKQDSISIAGGRDLAIQAVNNGWAAIVIEQKGFGERAVEGTSCDQLSLRELMAGNTMLGDRVEDIITTINFIDSQPRFDKKNIGCIGNSSGGTTSYFAAAVDPRISLAVVSCAFSTYESSWLKYQHCSCGFIPGILEVGDMPEFAALIAPRKLIIIAGKQDHLADIEGVRKGFTIAKNSYHQLDSDENIILQEGEGGHMFYPDLAWPVIQTSIN